MPDYKRHGARYRARRRAVDILFEAETRDVDPEAIVEDRAALAGDPTNAVAPVADYTREIIAGAAAALDEIDNAIERFLSDNWELNRIPAVDRAILRVATWEILYNDEVEPPISIANAMEMSTEYAGDNASPYIHAVLDDIIQAHASNAPEIAQATDEFGQFTDTAEAAAVTENTDLAGTSLIDANAVEPAVPSEVEEPSTPAETSKEQQPTDGQSND